MAEQWVKWIAIAIAIAVLAMIIALPAVSFRKLETDEGKIKSTLRILFFSFVTILAFFENLVDLF